MKVLIPPNSMDLNQDGKVTIDELARSTVLIFAQLVILMTAFVGGIALLILGPWFVRIIGAIVSLSAIGASGLGVYRMLRYERMESRDKTRWELEHKRAEWEFNQARGVSEDARSSTVSQAQIDVAAMQILQRYYSGKEWSRDALVGAGLMTADLWNEANALFKKRGIRRGRKTELIPDTFADAWALYCEAKLRANQHRIANGDWTEAK